VIANRIDRARSAHPFIGAAYLVVCLTLATALSYNALPRNDALVAGHGWSVGQADIEAVRAIEHESHGQPYTVLANQSVSAAAVSQLGFKRYHGETFFYPIPTGGELYNTFLRMTYNEPSRETAREAAKLGGTNVVYLVVNDYWWNARNLNDTLVTLADSSWAYGDASKGPGHATTVYKFDFTSK